jgi:hypothetical protein
LQESVLINSDGVAVDGRCISGEQAGKDDGRGCTGDPGPSPGQTKAASGDQVNDVLNPKRLQAARQDLRPTNRFDPGKEPPTLGHFRMT